VIITQHNVQYVSVCKPTATFSQLKAKRLFFLIETCAHQYAWASQQTVNVFLVGNGCACAMPSCTLHYSLHSTTLLVLLSPEWTTFSESSLSSCRLAQHGRASNTQHNSLSMTEHGRYLVATWTLNVHEVWIWALNEAL